MLAAMEMMVRDDRMAEWPRPEHGKQRLERLEDVGHGRPSCSMAASKRRETVLRWPGNPVDGACT